MRNLQKLLALVLALVMSLALVTVAGASDYTDPDTIEHEEAVEVVSTLGILEGFPDGSFQGGETVTRAQMATVISKMLGMNTSSYAGVAKFTDVKAGAWYENAISACYAAGIIKGYTNGAYGPSDPVTTAQATLMVIRALGVKEQTGDSYIVAAMAQGEDLGLLEDLTGLSANKGMSRDAVAQLTLNALVATPEGDTWAVVDATGKIENDGFASQNDAALYLALTKPAGGSDPRKVVKSTAGSLLEKKFDAKKTTSTDEFGREATVYTSDKKDWDDDELVFPTGETVITYTKHVDADDIKKDLKGYTIAGKKDTSTDTTWAVDGTDNLDNSATKINPIATIDGQPSQNVGTSSGTVAAHISELTKNGSTVEIYATNKAIDKIVVVNEYLAQVSKVTEAKGDDARKISLTRKGTANVTYADYETKDFAKDDYVLVTALYGATSYTVKSVKLAQKIENVAVTAYTGTDATGTVTAGGTKYNFSKDYGANADTANNVGKYTMTGGATYTLYLDSQGNVIRDDTYTADSTDYLYLLKKSSDAQGDSVYGQYTSIQYVDLTGTVGTAKLWGDQRTPLANTTWFTLSEDADHEGYMKFTDVASGDVKKANVNALDPKTPAIHSTIVTNEKTIFVIESGAAGKETYKAFTGIANVPKYGTISGSNNGIAIVKDNFAVAVMLKVGTAAGSGTKAGDLVYLSDLNFDGNAVSEDGKTALVTLEGVVNGAKDSLKIEKSILKAAGTGKLKTDGEKTENDFDLPQSTAKGLFEITYDTNGYVIGLTKVTNTGAYKVPSDAATKKITYQGNTLTIADDTSYILAANAPVYTIDDKGDVTVGTAQDLVGTTSTGAEIYLICASSDDTTVTAIYYVGSITVS